MRQILDAQEAAGIDEETPAILKQIVIDGHERSHPHLPVITKQRAAVLVVLMKDVLYQLYVRKGKVREATALRQEVVAEKKAGG